MWYVYVLQSFKDGKLYTGISESPEKRLIMHNSGMTKSTRGHRPFRLICKEECGTRTEARDREKFYKTGRGREYLKSIIPE